MMTTFRDTLEHNFSNVMFFFCLILNLLSLIMSTRYHFAGRHLSADDVLYGWTAKR